MVSEVVPLGTVTLPEINCQLQGIFGMLTTVGAMLAPVPMPMPLNITSILGRTSKQHCGIFLTLAQNRYSPATTATVCCQMDVLPVWPVLPLTTMNVPGSARQVPWFVTAQFEQIFSACVPVTTLYWPGSGAPGSNKLLAAYWLVMPGQTGGSAGPMGVASNSPFVKRLWPGQHPHEKLPTTNAGNPYWLIDPGDSGNRLAVADIHPPFTAFGLGRTYKLG